MIQISRTDLQPLSNQCGTGFTKFQRRANCSRIWEKLERIGLSSTEDEKMSNPPEPGKFAAVKFKYEKFTGKVLLKIRGTGIRDRIFIDGSETEDRAIMDCHRKYFKNEVYGSIKSFQPLCGEYFSLWLHYNGGVMDKAELEDTTKTK